MFYYVPYLGTGYIVMGNSGHTSSHEDVTGEETEAKDYPSVTSKCEFTATFWGAGSSG